VIEQPLLMAHDAAMAYRAQHGGSRLECRKFKSQAFREDAEFHLRGGAWPSGFSALLDCGARALDLRLGPCPDADDCARAIASGHNVSGHVYMHHGGAWILHTTFETELESIVRWSQENDGDLVILKLVPDGGGKDRALQSAIHAALQRHDIPSVDNLAPDGGPGAGCWNGWPPWTLWYARRKGIIAVWKYDIGDTGQPNKAISCVEDNFVPHIGFNPWAGAKSFRALSTYATNIIRNQFNEVGPNSPKAVFQEVQLIWQTAGTEIYYELFYNLLGINHSSKMNQFLVNLTQRPVFLNANLVKMNNLCEHGLEVAENLGTTVTAAQRGRCASHCGGLQHFNPCVF